MRLGQLRTAARLLSVTSSPLSVINNKLLSNMSVEGASHVIPSYC